MAMRGSSGGTRAAIPTQKYLIRPTVIITRKLAMNRYVGTAKMVLDSLRPRRLA
jgi:hypothetical protein